MLLSRIQGILDISHISHISSVFSMGIMVVRPPSMLD